MSYALKPPREPRSDYWLYLLIAAVVVVLEYWFVLSTVFSPNGKGF